MYPSLALRRGTTNEKEGKKMETDIVEAKRGRPCLP